VTRSAIVIPVFKGMPQLADCLASLSWVARVPDVDAVLVDCGSEDGSRAFVAEEYPWVLTVEGDPSMWWSAATNRGCRWAVDELGADTLCLLNHDCRWPEQAFRALLGALEGSPTAIHCSRVCLTDGRLLFAGGYVARSGRLMIRGYYASADPGFSAGRVDWAGGQGVMFPAALWRRLGGFDERALPHYHADADFSLRARSMGAPTLYHPESTVVNDNSSTGLGVPRDGASLRDIYVTLVSRKSSANVRDAVRLYARHAGWRLPSALAHLYGVHLGSSLVRVLRSVRRRFRVFERQWTSRGE